MNRRGYTIAEVLIAVLVVGIGLTAAATLVNSLLGQEQLSASSVRAANLQEQAVMLTRLGVAATNVRAILPETVGTSLTPSRDQYSMIFFNSTTNIPVSVGAAASTIRMDLVSIFMIYRSPTPGQATADYIYNTEAVLLPAIR
jgi:prepilin-type N-terminal cleavage/methylation domain-containing protein